MPLYAARARRSREHGITVVATGEGADELFWGYDLFKEVAAARARTRAIPSGARAARRSSTPTSTAPAARRGPAWRRFFLEAGAADDPLFSHMTARRGDGGGEGVLPRRGREPSSAADASLDRLRDELPPAFARWSALERAA